MIDGVVATCRGCGLDLEAESSISSIVRVNQKMLVEVACMECGRRDGLWFDRMVFRQGVAPVLRWWIKREGQRVFSPMEIELSRFALQLREFDTVEAVRALWEGQPSYTVPLESDHD